MVGVVYLLIPRWRTVRPFVALSSYAVFLYVFVVMLMIAPRQALAVQYSRVVTAATQTALVAARSSAMTAAAGSLMSSSTGSVAVRLVASAAGWPVMGVLAGATLLSLYYNNTQTAAIKAAAAPPGAWSIPGYTMTSSMTVYSTQGQGSTGTSCPESAYDYCLVASVVAPQTCSSLPAPPATNGWNGSWNSVLRGGASVSGACESRHSNAPGFNAGDPSQADPQPATGPQIAAYIDALPSGDPNSVSSNVDPGGMNNPNVAANSTSTIPVDSTDAPTTVIPTTDVQPNDAVVASNVSPPAGTQDTAQTTQTQTQTTSTTDPNTGVVTKTDTDTSTVQCNVAEHDQRSFGTILKTHMDTWTTTGVAAQLSVLQSLTWPDTIPIITVNDSFFGTLSIDFTAWAAQFAAIRLIVIAGATLAAYRVVFGGG